MVRPRFRRQGLRKGRAENLLCILEGCDGGGKSTLARQLAAKFIENAGDLDEYFGTGPQYFGAATWLDEPPDPLDNSFGVVVVHKGQPHPKWCPFTEYETPLHQGRLVSLIQSPRHLVITDRWHAGEWIYGRLYRDGSRLSQQGFDHVELALTAAGAIKYLVQPPSWKDVQARLTARGDETYLQEAHVEHVHSEYEKLSVRYEWHRAQSLDEAWEAQFAEHNGLRLLGRATEVRRFTGGSYLGSLTPRVLLCGDKRGRGPHGRPDLVLPFTPTIRGSSSEYLLRAISLAGLINDVGLVNVCDYQPVNVTGLWEAIGKPPVVALGDAAAKALAGTELKFQRVAHPQWTRRFRSGQEQDYAEALLRAANDCYSNTAA